MIKLHGDPDDHGLTVTVDKNKWVDIDFIDLGSATIKKKSINAIYVLEGEIKLNERQTG